MYTDEEIVKKYLEIRDQKTALENRHKLELMPLNDNLRLLENVMGVLLAQRGKNNSSTPVGTAFKKQIFSVTATDLNAFINFAIDNDQRMLDIKPSTTGVKDYIDRKVKEQSKLSEGERKPVIIPGIKTDRLDKIQFRKV